MKRAIRRVAPILIAAMMLFNFCGCDIFTVNTDEFLSPPKLTGDMQPILEALNKSVLAEYSLVYPNSGDRRSAVIMEDINLDGKFEAIAFYKTNEEELSTMHINLIMQSEKNWVSVDDISIVAGGVETVDFCDLDGNGTSEILVGWEIYTGSEKQLAVYSLGANSLSQAMIQRYTHFMCCDIDQNGNEEIFLQDLNPAESTNRAILFSIDKSGVSQIAGCMLDGTVKSASYPVLSKLANGQPAIYIDEDKGVGAVTEVLYCIKGQLVNGLLDTTQSPYQNNATIRPNTILCRDIDDDGTVEIPIEVSIPNADPSSNEKITYVKWCKYTGEVLQEQETTLVNVPDGYIISVPNIWKEKIAVSKDIQKRTRSIYLYNTETQTIGEKIVTFKATEIKKYKPLESEIELIRTAESVITATVTEYEGELKLNVEQLKKMLRIF